MRKRRPWQEELEIVDRTMKAISGVTDPEELVDVYWNGIGQLIPTFGYVALSRRNEQPPFYVVTRSSRFTEHLNPWTQRDLLPKLSGGVLGEIIYANKPVIINDLPASLKSDDPGYFFLEGFQQLIAFPNYDGGEGVNATAMLLMPDEELDPSMIPILHWQSGLFGRGTQNLVLKNELGTALKTLDKELQVVGRIQQSLLPENLPTIADFEMAAFYQTSARAGGDYYDFFPLSDGQLGLFIADVSGHGTPAAVLMAITHAIAHAQPGAHTPPQVMLAYLNDHLASAYTRNVMFVTAFYSILDPQKKTLTYSRAGHNPPRLVRGGKVLSLEHVGGLPLGIETQQQYKQASIQLQAGDLLLLYTDGITEASPPLKGADHRELFGLERLDNLLLNCGTSSAEQCLARIRAAVSDFSENAPQADDQTLIAIRCL